MMLLPCGKKKKTNFTSFGQPTKLITCANHSNNVTWLWQESLV